MELWVTVLHIEGGKNKAFSLDFIFSHVLICTLRSLTLLVQILVHYRDAYFLNLRARSFTFLHSGTILVFKDSLNGV